MAKKPSTFPRWLISSDYFAPYTNARMIHTLATRSVSSRLRVHIKMMEGKRRRGEKQEDNSDSWKLLFWRNNIQENSFYDEKSEAAKETDEG